MGPNRRTVRAILDSNYPFYFTLYDHKVRVSIIRINDREEWNDLSRVIKLANDECNHGLPGDCISIKRTSYANWKVAHP